MIAFSQNCGILMYIWSKTYRLPSPFFLFNSFWQNSNFFFEGMGEWGSIVWVSSVRELLSQQDSEFIFYARLEYADVLHPLACSLSASSLPHS